MLSWLGIRALLLAGGVGDRHGFQVVCHLISWQKTAV
jgi:hypothetical protein